MSDLSAGTNARYRERTRTTPPLELETGRPPRLDRIGLRIGVCAVAIHVLCLLGADAHAQGRRTFMFIDGDQANAATSGPTHITMDPGTTIHITVYLEDTGEPGGELNAYQLTWRPSGVPQDAAPGSVTYLDNPPEMGGGDSIFLDTTREDWALSQQVVTPVVYNEETKDDIFGLFYATINTQFTDPAGGGILYLAEFDLQASEDACGEFHFPFHRSDGMNTGPFTGFFNRFGGPFFVDEYQTLIITVDCSECDVGAECPDGDLCTQDLCIDGVCENPPVDCTQLDGQCAVGVCNPGTGECEAQPINEGQACNDGQACQTGETCQSTVCSGGAPVVCDSGDPCSESSCDPGGSEGNCDTSVDLGCNFICADTAQAACTGCTADCSNCAQCEDLRVQLCEVISYACQWQTGCNDELSCVTRAAFIWQNGECYCWDEVQATWFPAACGSSGVCPSGGPAPQAPRGLRAGFASPAERDDRLTLRVQLRIEPPLGTGAYGLEEYLPAGADVLEIGHGGIWDESSETLKWGPFLDGTPRTISYVVRVPRAAAKDGHAFFGEVSFNGLNENLQPFRTLEVLTERSRQDDPRQHPIRNP